MRSRGRFGEPARRARGAIQNTSTETRRRSQKDRCQTQGHHRSNFCVLRRSSVDALPLRMPRALAPRVPKPKITLTTDFTDYTDEERPDSISVQSVSSVVQNRPQATDLRRQERSGFGRKTPPSDARRTVLGRKMPQAVIAPSCAVYSSSGAIGKSSDGSDAKSRNTW